MTACYSDHNEDIRAAADTNPRNASGMTACEICNAKVESHWLKDDLCDACRDDLKRQTVEAWLDQGLDRRGQ